MGHKIFKDVKFLNIQEFLIFKYYSWDFLIFQYLTLTSLAIPVRKMSVLL